MGNSIQDYLKKINSRLSFSDALSLLFAATFLALFAAYLFFLSEEKRVPVVYRGGESEGTVQVPDARPYGSKNGTTYTYYWCQGSSQIKAENRVYFRNADEAESSGRRISKFCQK